MNTVAKLLGAIYYESSSHFQEDVCLFNIFPELRTGSNESKRRLLTVLFDHLIWENII